jgi:hypothetical protein
LPPTCLVSHGLICYPKFGIGIPPNININRTATIIPKMMTGIRKRNAARTIIAKPAIIKSANKEPSKASISTNTYHHEKQVNNHLKGL